MTYSYAETLATLEEILGADATAFVSDDDWATLWGEGLEAEEELDFNDCF